MSNERGFALPFTLFVIALITMLLAGVLGQVQVDRRIAESVGDGVDATAIAQSGLQTFLALLNVDACFVAIRPPDGDSTRINVPGGMADHDALATVRDALLGLSHAGLQPAAIVREKTESAAGWATILFSAEKHEQYGGPEIVAGHIRLDCQSLRRIATRNVGSNQSSDT